MLFLLQSLQYFKTNLEIHSVGALSVQTFEVPQNRMLKVNEI